MQNLRNQSAQFIDDSQLYEGDQKMYYSSEQNYSSLDRSIIFNLIFI